MLCWSQEGGNGKTFRRSASSSVDTNWWLRWASKRFAITAFLWSTKSSSSVSLCRIIHAVKPVRYDHPRAWNWVVLIHRWSRLQGAVQCRTHYSCAHGTELRVVHHFSRGRKDVQILNCNAHEGRRTSLEIDEIKTREAYILAWRGLASDDVTGLSIAWQRGKLVRNKDSAPYKSMLGEKSLNGRSSLFLREEVRTVLTTPSQLIVRHISKDLGYRTSAGPFFGRSTLSQHALYGTLSLFRTNYAGCCAVT